MNEVGEEEEGERITTSHLAKSGSVSGAIGIVPCLLTLSMSILKDLGYAKMLNILMSLWSAEQ